ncbi:MAG: YecR-like lipofamily protein [Deltaproteobacteria bacterium]|nr:YecR-like lipofamily protein [Deltaproteobacteria bacterium]
MPTKKILFIVLLFTITGCASKAPTPTKDLYFATGSRADSTLILAYSFTEAERGRFKTNDNSALQIASDRCKAWGLPKVIRGEEKTYCARAGQQKCEVYRIEREYLCSRN